MTPLEQKLERENRILRANIGARAGAIDLIDCKIKREEILNALINLATDPAVIAIGDKINSETVSRTREILAKHLNLEFI